MVRLISLYGTDFTKQLTSFLNHLQVQFEFIDWASEKGKIDDELIQDNQTEGRAWLIFNEHKLALNHLHDLNKFLIENNFLPNTNFFEMATADATLVKWNVDQAHSEIQFKVKHLVISTVTGRFTEFDGNFEAADDLSNLKANFEIDAASIFTNQNDRDNHLKSADFFDVENFPKITFESDKLTKKNDEDFELTGNLTIKDVTKPVFLNVTFGGTVVDPYGQTKVGFEIEGKISRKEFGLTWSAVTEAGGAVVGDNIKIAINVQFIKQ